MKISPALLQQAVLAKIISSKQADELIDFIKKQPETSPAFCLTNVLYYLGGLLAIGAMTLFMNLGWQTFGGWGIFSLSLLYAALGLWLRALFEKRAYKIPAGICATFVIALTPLAIYGFQQAMGLWPDDTAYRDYHLYIRSNWVTMELGTLLVGALLLWFFRYPFMIMPLALTLWYLSMDLADLFTGSNYGFQFKAPISMYFGLLIMLAAFVTDLHSRKSADYAFWLYLFGVMAFWCGLTAQSANTELANFIYLCINLLMIVVGTFLNRKVFIIFGALGCGIYLGHLAYKVFQDSFLFPITLTCIGFTIIYLGTLWQKYEPLITKKTQTFLPKSLRELLETRGTD